jgi:FlaA1/EpsC-like NDP-sugar epimerase
LDQNEEGLYRLIEELNAYEVMPGSKISIKQVLASVNHEAQLRQLFLQYRPDVIYHAAAYKHVPIVEDNPIVGAHNNIFGTLTIARLADEFKVPRMILVSTDKAVRPTNVMGATKRVAELVLQGLAQTSSTIFSMVRFGNVLNSSGSVVPKFRQQIENGGPITITDLRVTRYFMMIPEAAQLVIQAGALATGGEVFLLDMGQSIKIIDLANKMIELSGLDVKDAKNPEGDIEIKEIGLRPGEKLYEELLIAGEPEATTHPRIFKSNEEFFSWKQLDEKLSLIKQAIESDDQNTLIELLQVLVQGYNPKALEVGSN